MRALSFMTKTTGTFLALMLACASMSCSSAKAGGPEVRVDPRVELMSIIFRLAENPEYNRGAVQSYADDVEARFGPFRDHAAVDMARKLRETRGVSHDAVMSMAIHIKDPFSLGEKVPFEPRPAALERRWHVDEAREFLVKARDFVKVSDFKAFVADHAELYRITAERMQSVMDDNEVVGWFNGRVLGTVVHEFCHSFANPIVDRHVEELKDAGQTIFPLVQDQMRSMAYSNWKTMMYESLVRSSVVRWDLAKNGRESAESRIAWEEKNHFFWISGLSELLGEYETKRDTCPDLESFFPEIKGFFDDYAAQAEERIGVIKARWEEAAREMAARAPKIVSIIPANAAGNVDPGLRVIRITFDRRMKDGAWGVMRRGGNMPKITGDVSYDETRTVFTIPVQLEPDTEYIVGLNSDNALAFQDEAGNPLVPTTFRFKTRGR